MGGGGGGGGGGVRSAWLECLSLRFTKQIEHRSWKADLGRADLGWEIWRSSFLGDSTSTSTGANSNSGRGGSSSSSSPEPAPRLYRGRQDRRRQIVLALLRAGLGWVTASDRRWGGSVRTYVVPHTMPPFPHGFCYGPNALLKKRQFIGFSQSTDLEGTTQAA